MLSPNSGAEQDLLNQEALLFFVLSLHNNPVFSVVQISCSLAFQLQKFHHRERRAPSAALQKILNDKIFVVRTSAWKDYISDPLRILNTDPRDWVKVGSN